MMPVIRAEMIDEFDGSLPLTFLRLLESAADGFDVASEPRWIEVRSQRDDAPIRREDMLRGAAIFGCRRG